MLSLKKVKASAEVELLRAEVILPTNGIITCRSTKGGEGSAIDYFIVHTEIAAYVKSVMVTGIESNPKP